MFDNLFVERLWRRVRYEEVCLKDYGVVPAARRGPRDYCHCYNTVRYHQGLEYRTPHSVHYRAPVQSPSGVGDRRRRKPGLTARPLLD